MNNVRRLRPLTIEQLRVAADEGTLTPQDLQQIRWIVTAKTARVPATAAEKLTHEITDFIRAYCENNRVSIKEFSERCGFHGSMVGQLLNGFRKQITLATILKLAEGCNMEISINFVPKKGKRRAKAS